MSPRVFDGIAGHVKVMGMYWGRGVELICKHIACCVRGGGGRGEGRPVFNLTTIIILLQIQVLNMGGGNTARVPPTTTTTCNLDVNYI